jgi:hypothetical protein
LASKSCATFPSDFLYSANNNDQQLLQHEIYSEVKSIFLFFLLSFQLPRSQPIINIFNKKNNTMAILKIYLAVQDCSAIVRIANVQSVFQRFKKIAKNEMRSSRILDDI